MDEYCAHDLTSVSLSTLVPMPPERRATGRMTTLLRLGKITCGGEQRLCRIRNISAAGAMLKLYQPIAIGDAVEVEVTPDVAVPARVIWTSEDMVGVAFDAPIDVVAALRGSSAGAPYRRVARTPRLQMHCAARLSTVQQEVAVVLCDLSLNGAKVEIAESVARGAPVALSIEGLAPIAARVRWCRAGRLGMEFDVPVQADVIGSWMAQRHRGHGSGAPDGAPLP